MPDPTRRHEHRYWDGAQWTDHVANAGTASVDPYVPAPPPAAPAASDTQRLWTSGGDGPKGETPALATPIKRTVAEPRVGAASVNPEPSIPRRNWWKRKRVWIP